MTHNALPFPIDDFCFIFTEFSLNTKKKKEVGYIRKGGTSEDEICKIAFYV